VEKMKILIIAATPFEIAPFVEKLETGFVKSGTNLYTRGELSVLICVTGVGLTATVFRLSKMLQHNRFDLVVNAGIAGSFVPDIKIGEVVHVVSDRFGDLGIEEKDGSFQDVFDLNLTAPDELPFEKGILKNKTIESFEFLKPAKGLTVNKVHGNGDSINTIRKKYPAVEVETLESAGVFYVCLMENVNFLAIRSISNFVEPRNKEAWNIPLAIANLNQVLFEIIALIGGF